MNARTIGWIGYDWFKLVVAIILVLLLLWLRPSGASTPAATTPSATAAPAQTAVAAPVALSAPVLASPAAGAQLAPGKVTFNGTAAPGSQVQLSIDGKPAGTATADASGTWSLDVAIDTPGDHAVVAQALDTAGTVAAASAPLSLSVAAPTAAAAAAAAPTVGATAAPTASAAATPTASAAPTAAAAPTASTAAAPTTSAAGGAAPAIGFPADGATLGAGSFTMTGTGTPGAQIEILDSDKVIGTATVGADGTWSFPLQPSGATAAYSARAAGTTDVTAKPIRVTFGAGQAAGCASLAANCDAWVTRRGGLSLRMRAGAGTNQSIIAKLPVGTQVKLLSGPEPANGLSWWRVRTVGGREGWVAGEELVLQPD